MQNFNLEKRTRDSSGFSLIEAMVGLIVISLMGLALTTLMIGSNQQTKKNALKVDSISLMNEIVALLSDPEVCKKNFETKPFAFIAESSLTQIVNKDGVPFYKVFNPAAKEYSGISKFKILGMSIDQSRGGASAANKTTTLVLRIATEKMNSSETDDDTQRQIVQMVRLSYTDAGPNIVSCRSVGGLTDIWTRKLTGGTYNDIFYAGGSVAIGTNDPKETLTVFGNGIQSGLMVSGAASKPFVIYNTTGTIDQLRIRSQNYDGTGAVDFININSTNGNIGFGVADPAFKLDLASENTQFGPNMILRESGDMGSGSRRASLIFGNDWNVGQDTNGTGTRDFYIYQGGTQNKFRLNIDTLGRIGIGTTAPESQLDVRGGIKIGSETTCDATREGTVRYLAAAKNIQVCDGTKWVSMVDPASMCGKMGGTWDAVTETCSGALDAGKTCRAAVGNGMTGGGLPGWGGAPNSINCLEALNSPIDTLSIPEAERSNYFYAPKDGAYGGLTDGVGYVGTVITMPTSFVAIKKKTTVTPGGDIPGGVKCTISGPCPSAPGNVWSAKVTCANGTPISVPMSECPNGSWGSTCFTLESKVLMADGTLKEIAKVEIGDWVIGEKGSPNRVTGIDYTKLGERRLMSMNGSDFFVTDDHPIGVATGWATFRPERVRTKLDSPTQKLLPGQILKTSKGPEVLLSLDLKPDDPERPLIQLHLDGDHTYYVNDVLVHNCGGEGSDGDGDGG